MCVCVYLNVYTYLWQLHHKRKSNWKYGKTWLMMLLNITYYWTSSTRVITSLSSLMLADFLPSNMGVGGTHDVSTKFPDHGLKTVYKYSRS